MNDKAMTIAAAVPTTPARPELARGRAVEPATSRLAYFVFILVNVMLFVRPTELIPALAGWPFYEWLIEACMLLSLPSLVKELTPGTVKRWPINWCVVGLLPAVALSQLSHFQMGFAAQFSVEFAKLLVYFLLLVIHVNTLARLRQFLVAISLFLFIVTGLALLQYYHYFNIPQLAAYYERQENMIDPETGQPMTIGRISAMGIFNNPNDLSRMLVICVFICLYFVGDKSQGVLRFLWAGPLVMFAFANGLTYSRGGLLGMLSGLALLFYLRFGKAKSIMLGALVLPALLIVFAGRQTNVNLSEGDTAYLRMLFWRAGFEALVHAPIFGTGMGTYVDLAGAVAHNSFVHAYTELGIFGGTMFFGLFYFGIYDLFKSRAYDSRVRKGELLRLRPYVMAILFSYGVGMLSSSRCYDVPTYTLAGIAASYTRLLAAGPHVLSPMNWKSIKRVTVSSLLMLAGLYVFVRLKT